MTQPTKTHGTCPNCGGHDCYTEWEDGGGYCHQCFKPSGRKREPMENQEDLTFEHRGYRGIQKELCEKYNVLTGVGKEGREVSRVYPYPHKPKLRVLPKDFSHNKGFTNDHLLGMDVFNAGSSKVITIVEGEDDWLSAIQILGDKWPVVCLPGAGTAKNVLRNKKCKDYLDSFATIRIATDGDKAGDLSASVIAGAFPNKAYRVPLTIHKDANEYLTNGKSADFLYAWLNSKKYVPEWEVNTTEQFLRVLEQGKDSVYVPTNIQEFDNVGLGLMQGHLTVFDAPEGIGKTELMRMLEFNLIENHPDIPFAFSHFEETQTRSLLGLASYKLNKNVTRRALIEDMDEVKKAISNMTERDNLHLFSVGVDEDPMTLVDRIKYFANVCDCKYVFFEPIQDLAHQRSTEDGTTTQFLDKLSVQLSRVAAETGVGIVTIAHQNAEGEIRDCKLISKQASVRVSLERDLTSMDEVTRNTTTLTFKKNRPVGSLGYAGQLIFDTETFTLQERML